MINGGSFRGSTVLTKKSTAASWKEKDKKKKKKKKSVPKAENEAPIPPEQQMEEMQ